MGARFGSPFQVFDRQMNTYRMSKPEEAFPLWNKTRTVQVDAATVRVAEQRIESCESCDPELAEVPFDCILDELTGCDPQVTDYVLIEPARCPRCDAAVRAGSWRSYTSMGEDHKVFVLPGTLVCLKND